MPSETIEQSISEFVDWLEKEKGVVLFIIEDGNPCSPSYVDELVEEYVNT